MAYKYNSVDIDNNTVIIVSIIIYSIDWEALEWIR